MGQRHFSESVNLEVGHINIIEAFIYLPSGLRWFMDIKSCAHCVDSACYAEKIW